MAESAEVRVAGYRILRPLGQGGMATVYLAVQESFDRQVALKVMSPALSRSDNTYGERFLREARIVAKLNDPHIVTVYEVGVCNGLHYLAMEYVPGQDLRANRASMSLRQCLLAVKQIALALAQAHHQGYVHRDIKPENILIHRHNGRAVLTDFGIAKPVGAEDESVHRGAALGTPSFMSPEQSMGQALDHRSDLYSLGVVSFFLLTGQLPFTGDSPVAVSMKHALDTIPRLPSALAVCQSLIDRAMAKHADQRFQSGHQLAEAIDSLLSQLGEHEQRYWQETITSVITAGELTQLSPAGHTRTAAMPMSVSMPAPVAVVADQTSVAARGAAESTGYAPAWSVKLQTAANWAWRHLVRLSGRLWRGLTVLAQFLRRQAEHLLPVLKRSGAKVSASGTALWANRRHNGLPLFAGVAAVVVLLLWWLLSDDWNRKTARAAYQDGELSKTEYNEILAELKKEHQEKLAELRAALEDEDLSREEFIAAVKEAKAEYSGEDDCGSWLGC